MWPLAAGAVVERRLELEPGFHRVVVEQRGIDVELELEGPGLAAPRVVDGPFDRAGEERLLIEATSPGTWILRVRAREPGAPPAGTIALRVEPLESRAASALAAERAFTAAGERYRAGGPEDRRAALALYRRAFESFEAAGEPAVATRALYAVAVLDRLLDAAAAGQAAAEEAARRFHAAGEPAAEAYARAELGLDRWLLGDLAAARAAFRQARSLHEQAGDGFGSAAAAANLCLLELVEGRLRDGVACYEASLAGLRASGAAALVASAELSLGRAYDLLGEPRAARAVYLAAGARQRATGDAFGEAQTLNNLGVLAFELGELDDALPFLGDALATFRALDRPRWVARALGNLGAVYAQLGEPARAGGLLSEALELWRSLGDVRGEATALVHLARVDLELGRGEAAFAALQGLVERWRAAGDRLGEAAAWAEKGRLEGALGRDPRASLDEARRLFRELGNPAGEALAGARRLALAKDGEAEAAVGELERLLAPVAERPVERAEVLLALARVERRRDRRASAVERAREAIAELDSVRARIDSPDLRAAFAGVRREAPELLVDLLMEGPSADPAAALAVVEAARARSLVELLRESAAGSPLGGSPLAERRRAILERLDAKATRAGASAPDTRAALEGEQAALLVELDRVDAEIRAAQPALAELTGAPPLDAAAIRAVVDPDVLLLVFALGEARSHLFAVTPRALRAHPLPGRGALEREVRSFHQLVSVADPGRRAERERQAAALATTLLGPVADLLDRRRLALVVDGALVYLPFAALPEPGGPPGSSLLDRHELVYPPSATALAVARGRGRRPAAGSLAVVADPVYGAGDARLPAGGANPASGPVLARLPGSGDEARAIAALAPEPLVLLGFEASRERVLGGALEGHRVVHFATHGLIDGANPAASALALAGVDREGRPRRSALRLGDVYGLRTDAELVVLSGCRTALGRELRGEGVLGFVRGFLYAGARDVVASAWPVDDRATVALMRELYRRFWAGESPAAALRGAQLALRRERRTREPALWAGFSVVGDWRWPAAGRDAAGALE